MKRLTPVLTLLVALTHLSFAQNQAYLGIYSDQISKQKAEALGFDNIYGNYVSSVVAGTPAAKAGLQPLDYIYKIGDEATSFTRDMTDLLSDRKAGEKSTLYIIRKGKKEQLPITFGSRSNRVTATTSEAKEDAFLGVSPHSQNDNSKIGVRVYIVENSTAEEMGMQDGDMITSINGYKIVDWSDLSIAINTLRVGEEVAIAYLRNDKVMQAALPIKSHNDTKRRQVIVSEYTPDDWGYLGIYSTTVSSQKAEKLNFANKYGSYVTRIIDNTSAEQIGLQPFDYVYGVNDDRTNRDESLTKILKRYKPGEKVTIHFIRDGKNKSKEVTLSSRSDASNSFDEDECDTPLLGVREYGKAAVEGVSVEIVKNSTAEGMGMQTGDEIIAINGHKIIDWTDISTAIDNMKIGETVVVEYLRGNKMGKASNPIKSYCDTHTQGNNLNFSFHFDNDNNEQEEDKYSEFEDVPIRDVDVDRAVVDLKDMNEDEVEEMRARFGIEMTANNDLNINNLSVFPNAETGKFEMQFNLPDRGETKISVYNAAGRQIYEYDLGAFDGDFRDQIDISQNGIGNYYLEIRQDSKVLSKKLLLQTR